MEHFTDLTWLDCHSNQLTTLPVLPTNLGRLVCSFNRLTALPALPSALRALHCNQNLLTQLPALPSGLMELVCAYNRIIGEIDVSGLSPSCMKILTPQYTKIAFDKPVYEIEYKGQLSITLTGGAGPVRFEGTQNNAGVGLFYLNPSLLYSDPFQITAVSVRSFTKTGSFRVTAYDYFGESASCTIKVKPTFTQWLIIIFAFGWIWY